MLRLERFAWSRTKLKTAGNVLSTPPLVPPCNRRHHILAYHTPPPQAFELLSGCLETEAELQVLLGLLPESRGGAGLLALGLLSTSTRCAQ